MTLGKIRERVALLMVISRNAEWAWKIRTRLQPSSVGISDLEKFDGVKGIRASVEEALRLSSPLMQGKTAAEKSA